MAHHASPHVLRCSCGRAASPLLDWLPHLLPHLHRGTAAAKPYLPLAADTILQTIGFGSLDDEPDTVDATVLQQAALQLRSLEYCNGVATELDENTFLNHNDTLVWCAARRASSHTCLVP